jgi:hypothetical protein
MRDWLFAVDDPQCYIRPVDVLICTVCAAMTLYLDIYVFSYGVYESCVTVLFGCSGYLLLRFILELRHP